MSDTKLFDGNRAMLRWMREAARKDVADLSRAVLGSCGTDAFHARNIDCAEDGEWPYEVLTIDQARAWANCCGFPLSWCYMPEPPYPAEEHVGREALMREQAGLCPMCGQPLRQEEDAAAHLGAAAREVLAANPVEPPDVIGECVLPEIGGEV
jgi:hypothetical protein